MAKAQRQAEAAEPAPIPWRAVGEPQTLGNIVEETFAAPVAGGTLVRVERKLVQPIACKVLAMSSSMAFVPGE
jgi:hypothetical protein